VSSFRVDRREGRRNVEDQLRLVVGEAIHYVRHVPPPNGPSSEL
jgi:hypothetical protein